MLITINKSVEREMNQDERWLVKRKEVMVFMEKNHKNLSYHRIEEHDMFNWVKANRKLMNAGEFREDRLVKFKELLALADENKRKNQYT